MGKNILIKRLSINNFKKINSLEVDFDKNVTNIFGANGTGKTTILDAFLWCLFGKDSTNRSDSNFNIKTLDEQGNAILKQDHEVTAILLVDGSEVTLKRCYKEKWGVGSNAGKLTGHTTEYYINDVKMGTKKEYDAEVSCIIPEEVFKMITNPLWFPSLPSEHQKNMLLEMAGSISDQEIASLNPDFVALLDELAGRPLHKFRAEILAKKTKIKDELKFIPERISERQRDMPEVENWDEIEKELKAKRKSLETIESQLIDKSNLVKAGYDRKMNIQKQIGELSLVRKARENEITNNANIELNKANTDIQSLQLECTSIESNLNKMRSIQTTLTSNINQTNSELEDLRKEYSRLRNLELVIDENEFVCPTCKTAFSEDKVAEKTQELTENFNQNKSSLVSKNKEAGQAKAQLLKKQQVQLNENSMLIQQKENELDELLDRLAKLKDNLPQKPDYDSLIKNDLMWIDLGNQISDFQNQLEVEAPITGTEELIEGKQVLVDSIRELELSLNKRDLINRANDRIKELEEMQRANNLALSEIERLEYCALEFQKAKDIELMNRINGMFRYVSFSFMSEQLNGNEKITCVCTVDGTPYPDVNNAGKINAGIDIINAICRSKGVTAPIFIDNRESINFLLGTNSQIVNLSVSLHNNLVKSVESGLETEYVEL